MNEWKVSTCRKFRFREELISKALTCPVCLNMFTNPVALPQCGHTLCQECAFAIYKNRPIETFSCPECRAEAPIKLPESRYSLDFPPNQPLRTLTSYYRDIARPTYDGHHIELDGCCHLSLCKTSVNCSHCGSKFCNACLFIHLERVQADISFMACELKNYRMKILSLFEGNLNNLAAAIELQVSQAIENLHAQADKMGDLGCQIVDKIRAIGEQQWDSMLSRLNNLANQPLLMFDEIEAITESSPLHINPDEVSEMYHKLLKLDDDIVQLEWLKYLPKYGNIDVYLTSLSWEVTWEMSVTELDDSEVPKGPSLLVRLHESVRKGEVSNVREMLLAVDPKYRLYAVNNRDRNFCQQTVLIQAVESGNLEMVKMLIEEFEADAFMVDTDFGPTVLILAVRNNHPEILHYLIDAEIDLVWESHCWDGNSALWYAVDGCKDECIEELIEYLDCNEAGEFGRTPFHLAARNGDFNLVQRMIEDYGADVTVKDAVGKLPIHDAVASGCIDMVKYFLGLNPELMDAKTNAGNNLLLLAAISGRIKMVEFLLKDRSADLAVVNKDAMSPLHFAITDGSVEMARLLLAHGADPGDAVFSWKRHGLDYQAPLLHFAAMRDNEEMVRALVEAKPASIHQRDHRGCTPLDAAKLKKRVNVARYLEQKLKELDNI